MKVRSQVRFPPERAAVQTVLPSADRLRGCGAYYLRLGRALAVHARALPFRPDYRITGAETLAAVAFKQRGWHRFMLRPTDLERLQAAFEEPLARLRELHAKCDPATLNHSGVAIDTRYPEGRTALKIPYALHAVHSLMSCSAVRGALICQTGVFRSVRHFHVRLWRGGTFRGSVFSVAPRHEYHEIKVNIYLSNINALPAR